MREKVMSRVRGDAVFWERREMNKRDAGDDERM